MTRQAQPLLRQRDDGAWERLIIGTAGEPRYEAYPWDHAAWQARQRQAAERRSAMLNTILTGDARELAEHGQRERDMTTTSLHGDNLDILPTLAPGSVQQIVTSPPYFGLRVYSIPPSHWPEITYCPLIGLPPITIPAMVCQLGAESDPLAYIGHLVHVFRLARPALRDDGTLWVNLADSYGGERGNKTAAPQTKWAHAGADTPGSSKAGTDRKQLLGIPQRAALALQADGWVWRSEIIWHAPNKMPESVRDRFTRAHEQILLFGNGPRYYFDNVAVAEEASQPAGVARLTGQHRADAGGDTRNGTGNSTLGSNQGAPTRNRRDVLSIPTSPMPAHLRGADEAHYAAWPPALVEVMIKAGSANKACAACGAAWVRQTEKTGPSSDSERPQARRAAQLWVESGLTDTHMAAIRAVGVTDTARSQATSTGYGNNTPDVERLAAEAKAALGGYYREFLFGGVSSIGHAPACQCNADIARCVILDPFAGTGTTGAVAETLGRDAILIDLGYQELQERRTNNLQITMEAFL